ncbi:MAG: HAMP domain-containing histidine kinase [Kofleriaceae bacterium]|nr:HAMP domain-containing histidine kinase [Kofleriaceae bacterium]
MRLSTRFGIGAAIAVLPLLGLIGFSLERMQSLARNNERLTARTAIASQVRVGILARLERIDEYSRKHTISKDAGYAQLLATTIAAVSDELAQLRTADLSDGERVALSRLEEAFRTFAEHTNAALAAHTGLPLSAERAEVVARAEEYQVSTRAAGEAEAVAASQTRAQTRRTAAIVAICALVSSVIALLWTVRALRARLREFIRATELVSRGKFSPQLDTSRDDELDRAAAAFNQMVGALGELDRIKADFISSISHELKTPLVAMQETTNLLIDEVIGPLNERQRRMLVLSADAGSRLSRMIAELLDLSLVRAGLECSTDRDLVKLTWVAVSQLEALALEREIELRSELAAEDLLARCDPDRFVQVVQNLIENALKYTPRGGVISVRLARHAGSELPRVGDLDSDWALLEVEDSGPGIPQVDRERVFEKFFRREGLASDGGAGLGLAICREIVEAHGGSVWVDDAAVLGGAALNVALPLSEGVT